MKQQLVNWALLLALLFAFQEAIVRAIFPLPEVTNFNRVNYAAFAREGASSFLAKRQPAMNASFLWNSKPDHASFVSHLNLYGFRDRQWNVAASGGAERVMFVGDSLTEGFMANDDETIAHGYESAAGNHSEAMNCGIGGNGIPEYLALIHDAVPLFHPRRLIVVLYANDLPVTDRDCCRKKLSGRNARTHGRRACFKHSRGSPGTSRSRVAGIRSLFSLSRWCPIP